MKSIIGGIGILAIGLIAGYYLQSKSDNNVESVFTNYEYEGDANASINSNAASNEEPLSNRREVSPPTVVTDSESATIQLFENTAPSVCYISTSQMRQSRWSRNIQEIPAGTGSGFIWDQDGMIVTNFHVIKDASKVTVTLSDMSNWEAELVGAEPNKDLAVLKINAPSSVLTPIKVGTSNDLKVGQSVYAIGNPFGLDQTLTTGIISATGREIQALTGKPIKDVIQTDAAINPGNSGGVLLNSKGKLIGVNSAIPKSEIWSEAAEVETAFTASPLTPKRKIATASG